MKLLFDQHLSPRLVLRLSDLYPDSIHVQDVNLDRASDKRIWEYARDTNLTIVTKDADFSDQIPLYGSPPKIVWIRRGNCSTKDIEKILRQRHRDITALAHDPHAAVLTIF